MYREIPKFKPDELLEYLRKSRSDDPNTSVEEVLQKHESILNEWIDRNLDEQIPAENIYREVVSGETIDGRPEMQKLLKRIESPKIKAILVVEVQRLSRGDLEDCGRLIKLLRYTHTMVVTPYKVYDIEDEFDRDAFERELKRGNEYLEYFKKIQKRGIDLSVQEGNYLGSYPPYGYNKIRITIGKKKCPTLEINEDEAKVVRMIFDWYGNEGVGSGVICNRLNEMGIKTAKGDRWRNATIRSMLSNEHYIGKIRYYYRVTQHTVVDQEVIKGSTRNAEYQLFDGRHEAIIDEELFYRIKNKRASMPKHRLNTSLSNPLASLFYCQCGECMSYKHGNRKPRYVCELQKVCNTSSVAYDEIIASVCDALKENIEDFKVKAKATDENLIDKHKESIALLEKKLAEAEQKEISLWEKYAEEGMPKHIFEQLREKCEEDKKKLEQAISKAYKEMPTRIDYEEKIIRFHESLSALQDDSISAEAKNKLLKTIIERINYSRPQSVRMSKEEADRLGLTSVNGWVQYDYELDIKLLV